MAKRKGKKVVAEQEPTVIDATILEEFDTTPAITVPDVQDVKDLILDPEMSLFKFEGKPFSNIFVGKPLVDFIANGNHYVADKHLIIITNDNRTFIVSEEFFSLFFNMIK